MTDDKKAMEEISFYKFLSEEEKSQLEQGFSRKNFAKGELVHGGSGKCSGVMLVLKGKLRVYILSDEGRDITLYYLEEGNTCVMSASCALACLAFDFYIEAEEDTSVIQINASEFAAIAKSNLQVENFALRLAVDRFSDVMWVMQQILFFSMDKRLAMYLYNEISIAKREELTVTHEQIAKALGSAREVVTRLLQQFQKRGVVELSRGKITVTDKKALSKLCD